MIHSVTNILTLREASEEKQVTNPWIIQCIKRGELDAMQVGQFNTFFVIRNEKYEKFQKKGMGKRGKTLPLKPQAEIIKIEI